LVWKKSFFSGPQPQRIVATNRARGEEALKIPSGIFLGGGGLCWENILGFCVKKDFSTLVRILRGQLMKRVCDQTKKQLIQSGSISVGADRLIGYQFTDRNQFTNRTWQNFRCSVRPITNPIRIGLVSDWYTKPIVHP